MVAADDEREDWSEALAGVVFVELAELEVFAWDGYAI